MIDGLKERERRERETFSRIAQERSALTDDALVVDPAEVDRYRAFTEGRARPVYSIEKVFELVGPRGKRVLEICCHHGENGALLALLGGDVDSVDLAEPLVELARRRIIKNNLQDRQRAHVMSVHAMEFADATFDVVFGKASLHHLDLGFARREIHRVLKPGGYAVFGEPVQLLPGMHALRRWIPITPDAESPDERPLSKQDLDDFCRPFARVETFMFRLSARLDRISRRLHEPLARLDRLVLDRLPRLAPLAGLCVFRVWK